MYVIFFLFLGYLVTVQFLMTFNFVMMTILLALLIVDYFISTRSPNEPRSALIRKTNTSDTALIYGLLLYVLYVFSMKEEEKTKYGKLNCILLFSCI
jgi:type IV secretory pathway VirB3-like protein